MPVMPRRLSLVSSSAPIERGVEAPPAPVVTPTLAGLMHQRRIVLSEAEVLRQVALAMLEAEAEAEPDGGRRATVVSLDDYRNRRPEMLANPA